MGRLLPRGRSPLGWQGGSQAAGCLSRSRGRDSDQAIGHRKLAEKLAPINDPTYRPGSEITLEQFMPKYEELRLATKKQTTQLGYKVVIAKHITPAFGKRALSDISEEDVQRFLNRKALGVAWNTLRNIKWAFSAIFTAAIKFGYAKHNPVRAADLPPEPVSKQRELPTTEQLQQLMDALDEEPQIMVWLDCITALHPSELLALRRSAIDFKKKCLWVREAVNHGDLHTPKYHRQSRPIRLANADLARLQEFMAKRPDDPADAWLFPSEAGNTPKEYVNVLHRKIQPKAKKLGLPHVTWRFASSLALDGLAGLRPPGQGGAGAARSLPPRHNFAALQPRFNQQGR